MNIKSFSDMKKDSDKNKEPINKQNYVGGGKSGLMVEDNADLPS